MHITGLLLFIIGIIVALTSAAKLPGPNTGWSDLLPIYIYMIAIVIAVIGVWLWQRSRTIHQITGLLLFIIGIIVALTSAAKLPGPNTGWSDLLPIYIYMIAIVIAVIGVWLWQRSRTVAETVSATSHSTVGHNILELLPQLRVAMQTIGKKLNSFDQATLAKRIDYLLNQYVLPLAAAREEVIELLGRQRGTEVLLAIAQGERLLNRVWSANSDGCLSEVYIVFPKALAAFEEAELYGQTLTRQSARSHAPRGNAA